MRAGEDPRAERLDAPPKARRTARRSWAEVCRGALVLDAGWSKEVAPRALLLLAALAFALYYASVAINNFHAFQSPAFDIGIFDQGIWLLSRFKSPFVTIMGMHLFGDHASYFLLFLVPLYWIWPNAQLLLHLQTLALAVSAVPVFLLARKAFGSSWLALLPAIGFLLAPALGYMDLENFHPDSFEVPLLLFALYFMTQRRWSVYLVMVLLLLLIKEDVPLLVVPLGIYVALKFDRKMGLVTAYAGTLWFIIIVFFLGPHFSGAGPEGLDAYRVPFGGFGGLLHTTFTAPWQVLADLLTADKIKYLIQLLAPVLFLPLFSSSALIVLPVLIVNLLSTHTYQSNIQYHYTSLTLAGLTAAAVFCLAKLRSTRRRNALVVLALLASVFSAYVWGPLQGSRDPVMKYDANYADVQALREAVKLIPKDAVVAARPRIATQLAHRAKIYDFPTPFYSSYYGPPSLDRQRLPQSDEVQYVIDFPDRLSDVGARVFASLQENEGFQVIFDKEGVVVLKRTEAAAPASTATPIYN
jgi:uncharacterized membrane protein